ncbi:MAG: hypothetical protein II669_05775, partial [Elusimicrobia bacterium]|nr:hypothetical protein [Elusimicrobiota bacterium]
CPSNKSVKKVCRKVKEETMRRKLLLPVEGVIKRLNLVLDGWGRYFKCGYPSRQFAKVNAYTQYRLSPFTATSTSIPSKLIFSAPSPNTTIPISAFCALTNALFNASLSASVTSIITVCIPFEQSSLRTASVTSSTLNVP